jgi:16S rRNA C967 or C1407 C5-methylase (RsmB/RsmF family)/NOL1/NOP2/fmu family ribosome biogenesis protein
MNMDFPQEFRELTRSWMNEYAQLEEALQGDAPVSIRTNPDKAVEVRGAERVMWCETGYYPASRPAFTFDPLFHAGAYYVQEAASMFLEQAIRQYVNAPAVCLDLCAAPGGKSTHLLSLLSPQSLLVSNEVIRSRTAMLTENLLKWGAPNVIITNSDPADAGRLTHLFDVIVADLPCSGEGMFRKEPLSRSEWSAANVTLCAARQRRIVHDVWPALKPGGICIYSTCTFNREENEENLRYLAAHLPADVLPLTVQDGWNIYSSTKDCYPSYRFFPHRTKSEGFFLAVLRKPDGIRRPFSFRTGNRSTSTLPPQAAEWLSGDFRLLTAPASLFAVPETHAEICAGLFRQMRAVSVGVPLGEWKGTELRPSPALALSTAFRPAAFPSADLCWTDAVRYLQKEALSPFPNTPKGHIIIMYRNLPLGFAKNIGTRANNLWPSEWRIRSRNLPEQEPLPSVTPANS